MNGYLLRKCRSEQQLMNELTKLIACKDFASKKMSELMKELAFFYVSPVLPHIPHSVLKDLCALLTNLKDKNEDLRIAKMALCFLSRIVDQFALRYQRASSSSEDQRTQSFALSVSVLTTLLKVIEKSELNHASLPRQFACLKLYAYLCAIFNKTDTLILRTKPLIQKSPVWSILSGDKKVIASVTGKKEFPTQLAALAATFHAVRFHMSYGEQETMLEYLFQAAFLPNCVASRHAAATLLTLFEVSKDHAKTVIKTLEWYLMKFRPLSLRVGDALATIYLVRLCGQISRVPIDDDLESSSSSSHSSFSKGETASTKTTISVSNLLDLSYDTGDSAPAVAASPPPSPIARQRQRLEGVKVSSSLASRLKDMLLDVLTAASEQKPSTTATTATASVPNSVLLVAIEETVKDSTAESCFMKIRGHVCVFEIVASVLAKTLRDAATNTVLLHRVCRVIQFTAECLDGAVLQMTGSAHQPQFLDRITERMVEFASHSNPFIACESLRALVWLLPRLSPTSGSGWEVLMRRLLTELPIDHVNPEARVKIAEAFFHRAVTNPSLHQHQIDMELLKKCLVVTLAWFQSSPCEWHATMLVKIWQTALRKSLSTMGDDVFRSITVVLDFQHHHLQATTELVNRSTLDFLRRIGAKYAVHQLAWFRALLLRLTKQMLLESRMSRRLSVQVMSQLFQEAQQSGKTDMAQQLSALMAYMQQTDPDDEQHAAAASVSPHHPPQKTKRKPDVFVETRIHSQSMKDVLGIQDLLVVDRT